MAKVKGTTRLINKEKIEDDNFIMSPKIDFAFKLLFGDPKNIDLLKALLCAILEVPKDELNELTIINSELPRKFKEDKKGILDVRAKTKEGKEIDIEKDENAAITQWMEFIAAKSKEVMEMLAVKNEQIGKAYDELQVMSKNEKARMSYEAREAEIHDQMTRIKSAKEEGAKDKAIKIAEKMLRRGDNIEDIVDITELSLDTVVKLKGIASHE